MRPHLNFIPIGWNFCLGLEHSAWDLEICRLTNLRLPACWPRLWNITHPFILLYTGYHWSDHSTFHPELSLKTGERVNPYLFQTIAKILEAIEKGGRQREMPCGRQQGRKHKEIIVTMLLIQYYVRQEILKYVCVSMCVCTYIFRFVYL